MRESLEKYVVVIEGMSDVLRLEVHHIAATAVCSNKPTDAQFQTLAKFARQAANSKVTLFPDCDEPGEAGFRDLLWKLAEHQVEVRLGWSSGTFDGQFSGHQTENFTVEEWKLITH
ncbi:MAG: hypothetical protein KDA69_00485 [Planctomycetaceae bacterium]|nr:hypothetical protein [Planctomycetaceae bacterium]